MTGRVRAFTSMPPTFGLCVALLIRELGAVVSEPAMHGVHCAVEMPADGRRDCNAMAARSTDAGTGRQAGRQAGSCGYLVNEG